MQKPKESRLSGRLSLSPLPFREAVADLLKIKPEPRPRRALKKPRRKSS